MRLAFGLCFTSALALAQEDRGRIEGRITLEGGEPVRNAVVVLVEEGESTLSDARGRFAFDDVRTGTHTVELTSGPNHASETVVVDAGATTRVEKIVDWDVFFENVTVVSASRTVESIVDAPSAITSVSSQEIAQRIGASGVPELMEFTPGVELTQQDVNSFNFNTRGFNNTLTRRVAVFIDGRNVSESFLGTPNWGTLPFPFEDYESVELVRGPSAALYGANASSGVLNMTTKAPRDSLGMSFRLTAGERGTVMGNARYAVELPNDWYMKLTGTARHWGTFAVDRSATVEYSEPCPPGDFGDCLPLDNFVVEEGNTSTDYAGGVRLDKYFSDDRVLTLEGATYHDRCCFVTATGVGRFLLTGGGRFNFARVNLDWGRYNAFAYFNDSGGPAEGGGGTVDTLDQRTAHLEAQGNWDLDAARWRFVAGGFFERNDLNGYTPQPIEANRQAIYGQVDREIRPGLNFIFAGRFEDGSIHDLQFSPRAALVWSVRPSQTLRFTYSEAFQAPALVEYYLETPAAPPADLSGLDGLCLGNGFTCGLGLTPVLAVGNPTLTVETVRSFEMGYRGLLGRRTYLTIDAYFSRNENFITNLLPQLGTPFGRLNPEFGPWMGPPEAESTPFEFPGCPGAATVADCIRELAPPILSNDFDGSSVLAAATFTNFGTVDTRGIELGMSHVLTNEWRFDGAATWFNYDLENPAPGFPDLLLPNAPEWQAAAGVSYTDEPWFASLRARFVDSFRWSTGIFIGDVESYTNVDLDAHYRVTPEWKLGVTVANLFDDVHYEFFGAPLLRRRALVHLTFSR